MTNKTKAELKKKKLQLTEEMEVVDGELENIDDQPVPPQKSIDELPSYELNTGDRGISTIEISNVKGKLNCIIIDSDNKIDLIVESSLGYLIIKRNQIYGITYLAPRIRIVPSEDDMRDILTFDKFNLDERLIITVIGPKNSAVKLIIRLD